MSSRTENAAGRSTLSRRAVEYAAALALDDVAELAGRLYRYNSLPDSPAWRRRVPDERAAIRLLALERRGPGRGGRRAKSAGDTHRRAIWQIWDAAAAPSRPRCKLYVSPRPAQTGEACLALLAELGRPHGPVSVKVAVDPASLLRPDRLIGYFATRSACLETARRIVPALAGMTAQGVPFTTPIGRSGLLSWGADPPLELERSLPAGQRSWRGWVTARLAAAIVAARAHAAGAAVAAGALTRLRAEGVDTRRWTPPWR
jgi:hypothetical protein